MIIPTSLKSYFASVVPQISKLGTVLLNIIQNWIIVTWQLSKSILAASLTLDNKPTLQQVINLFISLQTRIFRTFIYKILIGPIFSMGNQVVFSVSQILTATLALCQVSVNSSIIRAVEDACRLIVKNSVFIDYFIFIFFIFSIKWLLEFLSKVYINYNLLLLLLTAFLRFG